VREVKESMLWENNEVAAFVQERRKEQGKLRIQQMRMPSIRPLAAGKGSGTAKELVVYLDAKRPQVKVGKVQLCLVLLQDERRRTIHAFEEVDALVMQGVKGEETGGDKEAEEASSVKVRSGEVDQEFLTCHINNVSRVEGRQGTTRLVMG
jgi:hypothetical protein